MRVSQLEFFKHGLLLVVTLLFLFANASTNKHLVHAGHAKLITFDHEVRRDLTRAERESVKTSVLSGRGEVIAHPPVEAAATTWSHDIRLNSYPLSRLPGKLEATRTFLDLSPVLNL
jgi:hypothetical protein